ncbi:MAG: hypothetical protein DIU68_002630 [Chloroflexota bacterium]
MSDSVTLDPPRPQPARKYTRPRHLISWPLLVVGLVIGVGLGLFYAWAIDPVKEFDTEPWQLSDADKRHYLVAIMLGYAYDGDLDRAVNRLLSLRLPGDPIQAVADAACYLASTGYVDSNSGLRAVRQMMAFYRLQGKSGCADTLLPAQDAPPTTVVEVVLPTATFMPPPTKTPTPAGEGRPTSTPVPVVVPTVQPRTSFVLVNISTFCRADASGVIEVNVQDGNGRGIPGQEIRVRWDSGSDTFFTGLKPERDAGYADFDMEAGTDYLVEIPGHSNSASEPLAAVPCTTSDGESAITSYRVVFRAG